MKFDSVYENKKYNLPKSYHFARIEYKDVNALVSEKIHFTNLGSVSDLVNQLDEVTKEEVWVFFEEDALIFFYRLGNMDVK